jgi:hypothetical protein
VLTHANRDGDVEFKAFSYACVHAWHRRRGPVRRSHADYNLPPRWAAVLLRIRVTHSPETRSTSWIHTSWIPILWLGRHSKDLRQRR